MVLSKTTYRWMLVRKWIKMIKFENYDKIDENEWKKNEMKERFRWKHNLSCLKLNKCTKFIK